MMYTEDARDKIISELEKDFVTELSKIDFSNYKPDSPDFMYPLSIGMLCMVLKKKNEEDEKEMSDIDEEISGSKKYLQLYKKTNDNAYHTLALDELRHAKVLVGLVKAHHPTKDVSEYEDKIAKLQSEF